MPKYVHFNGQYLSGVVGTVVFYSKVLGLTMLILTVFNEKGGFEC